MEAEIAKLCAAATRKGLRPFIAENRAQAGGLPPGAGEALRLARPTSCARRCCKSLPLLRPPRRWTRTWRGYFRDPRVRLAFSFQTKYLGMSPVPVPEPVHHPVASWNTSTASSTRSAAAARSPTPWRGWRAAAGRRDPPRRAGRAHHLRRPPRDRRRRAAPPRRRCGGGERRFRPCHAEADPGGAAPRWTDAQDRQGALFLLDLHALSRRRGRPPGPRAPHDPAVRGLPAEHPPDRDRRDPPTCPRSTCSNPGATDPTLAPPGHSGLYVLVPVPNLRDAEAHRLGGRGAALPPRWRSTA